MKIVCENCSAKYSIADEKVKGKVFKIRCKKCGESIVVRGDSTASEAAAEPEAQPEQTYTPPDMPDLGGVPDEDGDEAQTKVFDYSGYSDDGEPEWHIVVEGEQQGPYTVAQIKEYLEAGSLDVESFIWKEGFDDWLPIKDVPDFSAGEESPFAAAPAAAVAAAPAEDPAPAEGGLFDAPEEAPAGGGLFDAPEESADTGGGGLFGDSGGGDLEAGGGGGLFAETGGAEEEPAGGDIFSSAPAEEEPAGGGLFAGGDAAADDGGGLFSAPGTEAEAGGDIFGDLGGADDAADDGLFSSTVENAGDPRVSAEQAMMTGQRNENSVLFSLSNLQALAADTVPGAPEAPSAFSAPVASGAPSAPGMAQGGAGGGEEASGLIDIRSLASSLSEEKESDVDDLLAIGGGGGFGATVGAPVLTASQPSGMNKGLIIGIAAGGAALIAVIVVVVFLLMGDDGDAELEALRAQLAELEKKGASEEEKVALAAQIKEQEEQVDNSAEPKEEEPNEEEPNEEEADPKGGDKPKPRPGNKPKPKPSSSSSSGSASSSGSSPKPPSSPKPGNKPKDELDALLGGGTPSASNKPKPKPPSSGGGGGGGVKPSLERADVQKGMNGVAGKVKACGGGPGTITVKAIIGGTGRVISAVATGSFAGTPVGNCAARAVKSAKFPKSQKNLTVRYPFKL